MSSLSRVAAATLVRRTARSPRSSSAVASSQSRSFAWREREVVNPEPIPPNHTLDSVKPPSYFGKAPESAPDPAAYARRPVTSARLIDPARGDDDDAVELRPDGTVAHAAYGALGEDVDGVPLEYLALLRPSAEAAAAVRALTEGADGPGTILVFGATRPAGAAVAQLAVAAGHAVVAVVGGEHSGNEDACDVVKGLTREPGCVVPEEIAMVKGTLRDLVADVVRGKPNEEEAPYDVRTALDDFRRNLLDYAATYPETLPAAVDREELVFKGKDGDRKHFKENMEAYLEQFPKGSPPIPERDLVERFDADKYADFKGRFHAQTTNVISGVDVPDFDAPRIVKDLVNAAAAPSPPPADGYSFDPRAGAASSAPAVDAVVGRPVLGAVVAVTPFLRPACDALAAVADGSLRDKVEALAALPSAERHALAAAASVDALAGGRTIVVGGTLPGVNAAATPTDEDVRTAARAMRICDDDDASTLNHFVQVYRAGDFPVYADYAAHRANEALAGPRQIVVTK